MIKIVMIRLMAARLASENIRWTNATERETARRLTVKSLIAA